MWKRLFLLDEESKQSIKMNVFGFLSLLETLSIKFRRMSEIRYFTEEGLNKLKDDLHHMQTKGRTDMARQIAEARDKGDLSENAEYDAAKDAQGLLELKISELSKVLSNSRVLKAGDIDTSSVRVLSTVKIKNTKSKKEFTYTLVSEAEASVAQKKISVTSPIGSSLLGKKIGDTADVTTPRGSMSFEVLDISINL